MIFEELTYRLNLLMKFQDKTQCNMSLSFENKKRSIPAIICAAKLLSFHETKRFD